MRSSASASASSSAAAAARLWLSLVQLSWWWCRCRTLQPTEGRSRCWDLCSPPECKHCVICSIHTAHPEFRSSSCWSTLVLRTADQRKRRSRTHRRRALFLAGTRRTLSRCTGRLLAPRGARTSTAHRQSAHSGIRQRTGTRGPRRSRRKTRTSKSTTRTTLPPALVCIHGSRGSAYSIPPPRRPRCTQGTLPSLPGSRWGHQPTRSWWLPWSSPSPSPTRR